MRNVVGRLRYYVALLEATIRPHSPALPWITLLDLSAGFYTRGPRPALRPFTPSGKTTSAHANNPKAARIAAAWNDGRFWLLSSTYVQPAVIAVGQADRLTTTFVSQMQPTHLLPLADVSGWREGAISPPT